MGTRVRLAAALALFSQLVTGCGEFGPPTEASNRPDILLISLDALRADHLSSHGYHRLTTPFLDELAARGTRFSQATVNTHGTPPSHTTMLSSLYQETHLVGLGLAPGRPEAPLIPSSVELLPEIFSRAGWSTVAVTGGGWMSAGYGFSRGFDRFVDGGRTADTGVTTFIDTVTEALGDRQPVFAFFHTYQVHSPYLPPDGYRSLFGEYTGKIQPTSDALRPIAGAASRHLEAPDFDYLVSQYDGEIRFLDDRLRFLFERLEEIGFLDNAVVLITSDHGEEFGDHGGVLHRGTLFDELVRVPFIVWGRGVPAGVVNPTLVSTIDIAPTLLAAAEIEPPPAMEGRNVLAPDPTPWGDQRVFAQYGTRNYSVRTPRYKLIRGPGDRLELFDLERDPRERRNLANDLAPLAAQLDEELETWRLARPMLSGESASTTGIDPATEERLRTLGYLD